MYAQLGNIIFEGLKGFEAFSKRQRASYAEIPLIEGRPRLQRTGDYLDEVSIGIQLHAEFCDPEFELQQLSNAKNAGEIMTLISGDGFLYGDFVITDLGEYHRHTDPFGNVVLMNVDVSLKEFYDPSNVSQAKQRKNTFGYRDGSPLTISRVPIPPQSNGVGLMQLVREAKSIYNQVSTGIERARTNPLEAARILIDASKNVEVFTQRIGDVSAFATANEAIVAIAAGIPMACNGASAAAIDLKIATDAQDVGLSVERNARLSGEMKKLDSAVAPVAKKVSSRLRI